MTIGTVHAPLGAFDRATTWLNSEPLTADGLRGKVLAVQFGTYSCINWIRTLPYVRAWARTYADRGLVVVGVQTPEFGFERDVEGVRPALRRLQVEHPVVLDNDYAIWNAFANRYWPALYVADGDGRLRHQHFGEGAYDASEEAIRELVRAYGDRAAVDVGELELAADWSALGSPETYLGHARGERRAHGAQLSLNRWRLDGQWAVEAEAVILRAGPGSIAYRFQARDVNLVLTPPAQPVRFTVSLDGRAPGDDRGLDVDATGSGAVSEPRLYQLVRQRGPVRERTVEIFFLDPGVSAYVFTFG